VTEESRWQDSSEEHEGRELGRERKCSRSVGLDRKVGGKTHQRSMREENWEENVSAPVLSGSTVFFELGSTSTPYPL
jgi:hypothetical protein